MRKLFALTFVLLAVSSSIVHAGGIGVGVFGGRSFPVLQDDSGNGTLFGVRAPLHAERWSSTASLAMRTAHLRTCGCTTGIGKGSIRTSDARPI